ncbi:MAG TPA: tetratricopeptide repeat protein [Thermoanaerobaculia bacterium]|jgi:tetratricopeptide (TPR) repeat protein|nr:tetratricopeptide repeat protein [Thermoanaerobaculia bacterium]
MGEAVYWDLFERACRSVQRAELAEAETVFLEACREARRESLPRLVDRAYCNWAAIRIERGTPAGIREGLSRVLGGSDDPRARQLAAYNLASLYQDRAPLRIMRFYAEAASRLAESTGDGRPAAAHLLGLNAMKEGRLPDAIRSFRHALAISLGEDLPQHATIAMSTLGYCLSLRGARDEGRRLLEESLAALRGLECSFYEPSLRLNLGFAALEMGEPDRALHQGMTVLGLPSYRDEGRFARYLAGEACAQQGQEREAGEHFDLLQKTYYPQYPDLTQILLLYRTHRLLNWLA